MSCGICNSLIYIKEKSKRSMFRKILVALPKNLALHMYVVEMKVEIESSELLLLYVVVIFKDHSHCTFNNDHGESGYSQETTKSL